MTQLASDRTKTRKHSPMENLKYVLIISLGCVIYSFGFTVFLDPNHMNAGGISGIAMILTKLLSVGSVGIYTVAINVPLFIIGYKTIGRRFFWGSVVGTLVSSVLFDVFLLLPVPTVEPLLAAIFGGGLVGLGVGIVLAAGASTGGVDIVARVIKMKLRNYPIGKVVLMMDLITATLTGIVFRDINNALYSAVSLFICSEVVDAVVYKFDYSKVALIITDQYEEVANAIDVQLGRGITLLQGQGYYARTNKYIILCAIKRQQLAELKELVISIDHNAFIILQEAHQVLGDGFRRYSKDSEI